MAKYLVKIDGQVIDTRTSDRTYTHAVVGIRMDGTPTRAFIFCGRPDLAAAEVAKRANSAYLNYAKLARVIAVPVEVDAAAQAAKKPLTHQVIAQVDGRDVVMQRYTSEKLARKYIDSRLARGWSLNNYRVEPITAALS